MAARGVHFALTRDEAKRLFAAKTDDALREFLEDLEESSDVWDEGRAQESDKAWDAIHRSLSDGTLEPASGEPPLNQCVLGGRELHRGDGCLVTLVRPDMVPHVAQALAGITREDLRARYDRIEPGSYDGSLGDEDFEYTWGWFEKVRSFYQRAAAGGHCVIFTVV